MRRGRSDGERRAIAGRLREFLDVLIVFPAGVGDEAHLFAKVPLEGFFRACELVLRFLERGSLGQLLV